MGNFSKSEKTKTVQKKIKETRSDRNKQFQRNGKTRATPNNAITTPVSLQMMIK